MAASKITCGMCGAVNASNLERCQSCGAKLEKYQAEALSADERHARRNQQDGFEWKWVFISLFVLLVLQSLVLIALPMVLPAYDPQGFWGLVISAAVSLVGGVLIGTISPGKTFIEPAVGALLAAFPTVWWLTHISDVLTLSMMAAVIGGSFSVMSALIGAFVGENFQRGTRGHSRA